MINFNKLVKIILTFKSTRAKMALVLVVPLIVSGLVAGTIIASHRSPSLPGKGSNNTGTTVSHSASNSTASSSPTEVPASTTKTPAPTVVAKSTAGSTPGVQSINVLTPKPAVVSNINIIGERVSCLNGSMGLGFISADFMFSAPTSAAYIPSVSFKFEYEFTDTGTPAGIQYGPIPNQLFTQAVVGVMLPAPDIAWFPDSNGFIGGLLKYQEQTGQYAQPMSYRIHVYTPNEYISPWRNMPLSMPGPGC